MADFRFVPRDPRLRDDPAVQAYLDELANRMEVELLLLPDAELDALMAAAIDAVLRGDTPASDPAR